MHNLPSHHILHNLCFICQLKNLMFLSAMSSEVARSFLMRSWSINYAWDILLTLIPNARVKYEYFSWIVRVSLKCYEIVHLTLLAKLMKCHCAYPPRFVCSEVHQNFTLNRILWLFFFMWNNILLTSILRCAQVGLCNICDDIYSLHHAWQKQ